MSGIPPPGIGLNPMRGAMRLAAWRLLAAAAALLALAACHVPDTSGADSVWSPKGINAANLAAMVADPADLVRGHTDPAPEHKLAAHAVTDLWANPTGTSAGGTAGSGASGGGATGSGATGGGASAGGGAGAGTGAGTGTGS